MKDALDEIFDYVPREVVGDSYINSYDEEDYGRRQYNSSRTIEKKQDELARILERTTKRYGLNQAKKTEEPVAKVVEKPVEKQVPKVPEKAAVLPKEEQEINTSPYQFNTIVEAGKLTPKGHSRIDCGVRWVKKAKTFVDFVSNYGILRVTPLTEEIVRVQFVRGQLDSFAEEVILSRRL